jgi:hypothetical protein
VGSGVTKSGDSLTIIAEESKLPAGLVMFDSKKYVLGALKILSCAYWSESGIRVASISGVGVCNGLANCNVKIKVKANNAFEVTIRKPDGSLLYGMAASSQQVKGHFTINYR